MARFTGFLPTTELNLYEVCQNAGGALTSKKVDGSLSENIACDKSSNILLPNSSTTGVVRVSLKTGNRFTIPTVISQPLNIYIGGTNNYIFIINSSKIQIIASYETASAYTIIETNAVFLNSIVVDDDNYIYLLTYSNPGFLYKSQLKLNVITLFTNNTLSISAFPFLILTPVSLNIPQGLCFFNNDNTTQYLYFVNNGNRILYQVDRDTGVAVSISNNPTPGDGIGYMCADYNKNFYVNGLFSVYKISFPTGQNPSSTNAIVTIFAGSNVSGYMDDNGISARFKDLYGICSDINNNLFVGESGNNLVRVITPAAAVTTLYTTSTTDSQSIVNLVPVIGRFPALKYYDTSFNEYTVSLPINTGLYKGKKFQNSLDYPNGFASTFDFGRDAKAYTGGSANSQAIISYYAFAGKIVSVSMWADRQAYNNSTSTSASYTLTTINALGQQSSVTVNSMPNTTTLTVTFNPPSYKFYSVTISVTASSFATNEFRAYTSSGGTVTATYTSSEIPTMTRS